VILTQYSTAKLNPYLESICIPPHLGYAFVPVLFNNSDPSQITYTLTEHISDPSTKSLPSGTVILKKKDILTRIDWSQSESPSEEGGSVVTTLSEDEAFDLEFGESEDPRVVAQNHHQQSHHQKAFPELQRTQLLRWIKVTKPGTIKLENVVDGKTDVRLREVEVPIVVCPIAQFVGSGEQEVAIAEKVLCRGDSEELVMLMKGVPPMRLEYQRVLGNNREETTVEGLDPDHKVREFCYACCSDGSWRCRKATSVR
jgi:nucleoporin POM152